MSKEFQTFWIGALSTVAGWALVKMIEEYQAKKSAETKTV